MDAQSNSGNREQGGRIGQLGKDALVYGLGGLLAKAVGFFLLPVYTRLFPPAEYGAIELLSVLSTLVGAVVVLGTDSAQSYFFFERRKDGPETQFRLVASVLQFRLVWGLIVAAVGTALSPVLNRWLFGGTLSWEYFGLVFLSALFTQLLIQSAEVYRLLYRPWGFVGVTLGGTLASAAAILILVAALDGGILGYWVGFASGSALVALIAWSRLGRFVCLHEWLASGWPKLLRFGLPLVPAGLIVWMMTTADRWYINAFRSEAEVGLYGVGAKLALIATLATESFRRAWWPIGLDAMHSQDGPQLYRSISRIYLGVALACSVALAAVAPWLVGWLAAPEYGGASTFVGPLAISSILYGFILISGAGTWKSERTSWMTMSLLWGAVTAVFLNGWWVPYYGGLGAAWATCTGMAVSNIILVVRGERLWRVGFPLPLLTLQCAIGVAAVAAIIYLQQCSTCIWRVLGVALGAITVLLASAFGGRRRAS